jgi:hypothetical protein
MGFGNFLPTYRQQPKAIKPLRALPPVPKLGEPLPGQRTMPICRCGSPSTEEPAPRHHEIDASLQKMRSRSWREGCPFWFT